MFLAWECVPQKCWHLFSTLTSGEWGECIFKQRRCSFICRNDSFCLATAYKIRPRPHHSIKHSHKGFRRVLYPYAFTSAFTTEAGSHSNTFERVPHLWCLARESAHSIGTLTSTTEKRLNRTGMREIQARFFLLMRWQDVTIDTRFKSWSVFFTRQVSEHLLPFQPSPSEHRVYLCERGLVRHPALHPLCHEQDSIPPPQGDHPGGWQQQQW